MHVKVAELYQARLKTLFEYKDEGVQSLVQIAANSLVSTLRYDSRTGVQIMLKNTPSNLLPLVARNPRLHYTARRAFMEQAGKDGVESKENIDEWVLRNEVYLRTDGSDWGLISLDDADVVFSGSSEVVEDPETHESKYRAIKRMLPPTTGFAFLDECRERVFKIQPSTAAFQKTFDRLVGGVLNGLDWNNVFVAGGIVLGTLMCVDEGMDEKYKDNDIDMYFYGSQIRSPQITEPLTKFEKASHLPS
jgi:hypothetical protein